jgi:sec-independent protein translocase protein TatA
MGLKWTEILLILFVLMILFGATRLPQLGSSLGSAIRNFKKGFTGEVTDEPEEGKKLSDSANASVASASEKAASKHS